MDNKPTAMEEYLKKPYTRIIMPAEEGGFTGEILEFPGCFAEGETANEILDNLTKAAGSWIEAALEQRQEIPEPFDKQGFGGKIALRLPKSLHRQAVRCAQRDETSLNQFLVGSVAARVGAEDFFNKLVEKFQNRFVTLNVSTMNNLILNFSTVESTGTLPKISASIEHSANTGLGSANV